MVSYLSERYRQVTRRRGYKKATIVVAHSILTACWHMLSTGAIYREQGPSRSAPTPSSAPADVPSANSRSSATGSPWNHSPRPRESLSGQF